MQRMFFILMISGLLLSGCSSEVESPAGTEIHSPILDPDCEILSIHENRPCTQEGLSCGGPCDDPCSFCNIYSCSNGIWTRIEVFPENCFGCGLDQRCLSGEQYCSGPGTALNEDAQEYQCRNIPDACKDNPTCDCLNEQLGIVACEEFDGDIQIEINERESLKSE